MASRTKPSAPATRASTRTRTPPGQSTAMPPATKAIKAKASTRSTTTTVGGSRKTRTNSPDIKQGTAPKRTGKHLDSKSTMAEQEPIMAYLRIRPRLGEDESAAMPYLEPLSDIAVRMTDPSSDGRVVSGVYHRTSTTPPSSIYKFSHVFLPSTLQADFFAKTTLPLVQDLLDGQNGLLFAYGVTNSGKTYTIQGSDKPGSSGIVPRTLDVIFNSIESLQSDGRYRPVRLYGVEETNLLDVTSPSISIDVPSETALAEVLAEHLPSADDSDHAYADPTIIKLDRNYEYSIWISYAEVYNEKVYDLLSSVSDGQKDEVEGIPRNIPNLAGQGANGVLVTRKALSVKPSPAQDAMDDTGPGTTGRYIAGLRQLRVTNATQAKSLVKLGQLHRRVFGTLANSQSSRSHGLITIKVLRNHRGDRDDPSSVQISRLTLVDLAGSERTKHTQTTGDRLKEAGSINKSLMVLGQCMEVMRANQKRLAQSLANPGQTDTRDVKKALALVPFRHSKLTEILMDYFAGDGRVVMIVNVNPYDTGFDENSHVMKFSALAREVSTVVNNAPVPRIHSSPTKPSTAIKLGYSGLPRVVTRKVTISTFGPGKKLSEAHLEVLEGEGQLLRFSDGLPTSALEDEEVNDDQEGSSDDEPINPLVDALFDEIEDLRLKLYEAEMRCVIVEAETREEVTREMEERMRAVERTYALRLMSEVERNERKMDAKIDMLHQAGLLGTAKETAIESKSESEVEVIVGDSESEDSAQACSKMDVDGPGMPSSPLSGKGKASANMETMERRNTRSKTDSARPGKGRSYADDAISQGTTEDEDEDEDFVSTNDDVSDDYGPPTAAKSVKKDKTRVKNKDVAASTGKRSTRSVSKLEKEIKGLSIRGNITAGADDSTVILPNRKNLRTVVESGKGEVDTVKKKKRQLGKKNIVTEDEVEEVVGAMEHRSLRKSVRRMGRGT